MINVETILYIADSLRKANCTKNQLAWKACECLASTGNDIPLGTMAELFGIERFRLSRMNVVFNQADFKMVAAMKDETVPLNVAYRITKQVPVAQRDKALAEYLAAPKGKHGRRNPKPGLVRGNPNRAIDRCLGKIGEQVNIINRILESHQGLCVDLSVLTGALKLLRKRAMEANV